MHNCCLNGISKTRFTIVLLCLTILFFTIAQIFPILFKSSLVGHSFRYLFFGPKFDEWHWKHVTERYHTYIAFNERLLNLYYLISELFKNTQYVSLVCLTPSPTLYAPMGVSAAISARIMVPPLPGCRLSLVGTFLYILPNSPFCLTITI